MVSPLGDSEQPFSEEPAPIRDTSPEDVPAGLEISLNGPLPAEGGRVDGLEELLVPVLPDAVGGRC